MTTYLSLVELLWRRGPQADQAVVLGNCAGALARWREPLHLCHVIQALLDVAKVARLGRGLLIGVGVPAIVPLVVVAGRAAQVALQVPALLSQFDLTLHTGRGGAGHLKKKEISSFSLPCGFKSTASLCLRMLW